MRAPAGLRYACLGLVAALAAVTGLLVNPAPAAAFGSPTPVLVDPANWPAELTLIKGQADLPVVDNAPLQAEIEETVTAASRAGRLLPVLRAIGTVGAGTTALTVGYYVGGVLNHKFHLSCRISSSCDPPAAQLGTYTVRSTTTPMTWDLIAGDSSGYWTPNRPTGWLVRFNIAVPGTGGADMNQAGYNCSSPCYSYPDADAFLGTVSAGTKWTASGPENGGVIAVARIQTDEEMDHSYKSTLPEPYSSGPLDITIPPSTFDGSTTDPDSDSDIADAVRTVLTGASTPAQIEIAKTIDPNYEGTDFTWLAPQAFEPYTSYLARLRAAGWLGDATVVNLDASQGDVEFGLDGVPCTSLGSGSTVGSLTAATFYVNPSSGTFGDDENPTAGATCGSATPTTPAEPDCSFHQQYGPWEQVIFGNEGFYSAACTQAREYLASLNPFDEDGTINSNVITIDEIIAEGNDLYGEDVREALAPPGGSAQLSDFQKVKSQQLSDPELAPHPFRIHFYFDTVTGKARLDLGYKIRFGPIFFPS